MTEAERSRILAEVIEAGNWLAAHENLRLSQLESGEWRVHEVTGSANDRKRRLIATGQTVTRAVMNARAKYEEGLK